MRARINHPFTPILYTVVYTEQICYLFGPVIQFYTAMDRTLPIEEHRLASRTANP